MIGYFTDVSQAETYFETERLETEAWDGLQEDSGSSGIHQKTKALANAFNRIYLDPTWTLPSPGTATPAELLVLQKAQAEMAYYLAVHLDDEDRRKGLQAQGVIEAGIVKEKYSEGGLNALPVPPFVSSLLFPWLTNPGVEFGGVDICRDENEPFSKKVCDL